MRLYLDDDCVNRMLVRLLVGQGHDVRLPAEAGLSGALDANHLQRALREQRTIVTRNYLHFEALHELIVEARGHHAGIIVIREDNDRRRDFKPAGVVRALANLSGSESSLADRHIILNQWR